MCGLVFSIHKTWQDETNVYNVDSIFYSKFNCKSNFDYLLSLPPIPTFHHPSSIYFPQLEFNKNRKFVSSIVGKKGK